MRILYLASVIDIPRSDHGGQGGTSHVLEVARNLGLLGVEVFVFCSGRGLHPEWINYDNVNVRRFYRCIPTVHSQREVAFPGIRELLRKPIRWSYRIYDSVLDSGRIFKWARRHDIDLIYERVTRSSLAGAFASRLLGVPLIAEVNDLNFCPQSLYQASAIVVPEPKSLGERFGAKCYRLPWGVDTERIRPVVEQTSLPTDLGLEGRPTVGFIGSFLSWHGADAIVQAAPLVIQHFPEVRFLMIGTGPEESSVIEAVRQRGLTNHFVFTGFVHHSLIADHLTAGNVFVAPYTNLLGAQKGRAAMACSLKVLEYMAAGKPVVVTEVANHNGTVEHGVTGLVISDAQPKYLADAICHLLDKPEMATQMGLRGRASVESKYSWRHHAESLRQLFENVL